MGHTARLTPAALCAAAFLLTPVAGAAADVPPTLGPAKAFSVSDSAATLSATVNPNNSAIADCHFEYGTTTEYDHSATCSPAHPGTSEVQQVTVSATAGQFKLSFSGQTTKDIRFNATDPEVRNALNALPAIGPAGGAVTVTGGPGDASGSNPYTITFTGALAGIDVEQIAASNGTTTLSGGSGASVATLTPGGAPANAPVQALAEVGNLTPNTAYHFRIVAEGSAGGPQQGEDASFATYPTAAFPQRGYELVSAFDTNGWPAVPAAASLDGEHLAWASNTLPGGESGTGTQFRASRNPDGSWSEAYVGNPIPGSGESGGTQPVPIYSAEDLSQAAFGTKTGIDPDDQNSDGSQSGGFDTYLRDANDGSLSWLSRDPRIPAGTAQTDRAPAAGGFGLGPVYISPMGGRVLFTSSRRLLPADVASSCGGVPCRSLYEWDEGEISLLGVKPGSEEGFANGSNLGSLINEGRSAFIRNAVSADGRRVAFESGATATTQRLYLRLDSEQTLEASASSVDPTPLGVKYVGADEDTRHVFFTSGSPLTADSSAPDTINPNGSGGSADLYRYDLEAPEGERLLDLTPHPGGAAIDQILLVSDDGRRAYFTSAAALTPAAAPAPQCGDNFYEPDGSISSPKHPQPCNLYLWSDDSAKGSLTLIARGGIDVRFSADSGSEGSKERERQTVASPDGSVFAFRSIDPLVPGRQTGGVLQTFVYDAERGVLSCASCPPDGSVPLYKQFISNVINQANLGAATTGSDIMPHVRAVSPDGALFFDTPNRLLGSDSVGRRSVYEYRDGRLDLVSAGEGALDSKFGEITPGDSTANGFTVFFSSSDGGLVPGVPGGFVRVYAARVGGGYTPPPPTPPCTGEDCVPVASLQPNYAAPATSTIAGRGNLVEKRPPRKCRKGKARRKGRCVPKHRHHPTRAHHRATNHNRGGAK
jgi:hypothetical protein